MPDLVADNPQALAWVDQAKAAHSGNAVFGKILSSVIWSDATGPDGEQLVPLDPVALVADINANGFELFKGHDPGFPLGKVLTAAVFTSSAGAKFVVAILGFYAGGTRLTFSDLGVELAPTVSSPSLLPALTDACWINFATDPRDVELAWVEDVLRDAPMRVERTELSHNALDPLSELIRLGLLFTVLVWNPFVTAIATEAGKDAYAGMRRWLRGLLGKLAELQNPVVEIQSHHDGCHISFIFRGTDVKRHYAAHDVLPIAAVQAEYLVTNMNRRGFAPKQIVYEFHPQDDKWFPSYAELHDGRFVTDSKILIAVEQLPSGLSLGLSRGKPKSRVPSVKQPLDGVPREIGFEKGAGFAQAEQVESKEEWITAAEASRLLKPVLEGEYAAQKTICKRAHGGLIRARAEQYMVDKSVRKSFEIPKDFWWAQGEDALHQNWTTGDFDTWIGGEVHLRAFGVSFLRADIEKMIPASAPYAAPSAPSPAKGGRRPKADWWEDLWIEICRQLYVGADSGPSRTVIPTHRGQRSGDRGQLLMSV